VCLAALANRLNHSGTEKNILEDIFNSVLWQFTNYQPSRNLEFNYSDIFPKLKIAYFNGKILSIFHKLNFTQNTLGCSGLMTKEVDHYTGQFFFKLTLQVKGSDLNFSSRFATAFVNQRRAPNAVYLSSKLWADTAATLPLSQVISRYYFQGTCAL